MIPPPPISTLFPYTTLFRSPTFADKKSCLDNKDCRRHHGAMLDVAVIEEPAAAEASLDPIRTRILAALAEPGSAAMLAARLGRSEEHTSELQSHVNLVCRLL